MSPTENTIFYFNLLNHPEGLPSFPDGTGRDLVLAHGHPACVGREHKGTQEREAGLKCALAWVLIPLWLLCWMTLGKLLTLSEPLSPSVKWGEDDYLPGSSVGLAVYRGLRTKTSRVEQDTPPQSTLHISTPHLHLLIIPLALGPAPPSLLRAASSRLRFNPTTLRSGSSPYNGSHLTQCHSRCRFLVFKVPPAWLSSSPPLFPPPPLTHTTHHRTPRACEAPAPGFGLSLARQPHQVS